MERYESTSDIYRHYEDNSKYKFGHKHKHILGQRWIVSMKDLNTHDTLVHQNDLHNLLLRHISKCSECIFDRHN